MNTVKIKKRKTLMVAHRGVSGLETENTNAAFVAAGSRSYYGIETDVHRTKDGKFAICHDASLKRISGLDIDVEESTLEELQAVRLLDKDGADDRVDLHITTPENYLKICKKYEKHAVFELKSDFTDEEIAALVEIVKKYGYLENLTFISFIYENLKKVRKLLPNQSVQFLFTEFTDEILDNITRDKMDIDVYYKALTKENVKMLHKKGFKINCWTVDDPKDAETLAKWGVDLITSNILE